LVATSATFELLFKIAKSMNVKSSLFLVNAAFFEIKNSTTFA
jgi:hypothetical protein